MYQITIKITSKNKQPKLLFNNKKDQYIIYMNKNLF